MKEISGKEEPFKKALVLVVCKTLRANNSSPMLKSEKKYVKSV
jgi:hypothetical protein